MDDNTSEQILPTQPLSKAQTCEIVRQNLGENFPEENQFIDDLFLALTESRQTVNFQRQGVTFTVCCGCIITTQST